MAEHEQLKDAAIAAIDAVGNDMNVDQSTCIDSLEELEDQCAVLLQGLRDTHIQADGGEDSEC